MTRSKKGYLFIRSILADFACDRLVLDLCSADTVSKILNLEDEDPVTNITLCLTLYFMRVRLFAVNCKGQLSANERIVMLWSSLVFMIHIDGAFITTKRNLINECIGLCFLIMRDDVIQPHRLTSEPSEHTFALVRTMVREFTVLDFENLVRKLDRFWIGLRNGRLKMSRHGCESDGYKTTIGNHFYEDVSQLSGSVSVNYHGAENGFFIAGGGNSSAAHDIWDVLKPIINGVNKEMKYFLSSSFGVTEYHSLIQRFESLDKFTACYKDCLKNEHSTFKRGGKLRIQT